MLLQRNASDMKANECVCVCACVFGGRLDFLVFGSSECQWEDLEFFVYLTKCSSQDFAPLALITTTEKRSQNSIIYSK
jgi:hypothetical protein